MKTFNYSTRSTRPDFQGDFLDMMLQATNKPNLISFAGGLPNPISFPTQEMAAATQKVLDQHGTIAMQYSIPEGYLPLRQFIAHQYLKQGIDISANDIIITNGSQQALDILSAVLIDEGDKILIEKPSYLAALQVFHLYNPKINSVTLNHHGIDLQELTAYLEQKPKFFYAIPTFQNPTGLTYDNETRIALANLLKKTNTIFIEDNPYGDLRFNDETFLPIYPLLKDQTILLGTFSKTVSPGMRIGWIACSNSYLKQKLLAYKQIVDLHTNIFGQMVLHQYLCDNSLEQHLEKIKKLYKEQAEQMITSIQKYFPAEVKHTIPQGGMFLWVTLPQKLTAVALANEAIKHDIAIAAGDPFYEEERNVSTLRLNYTNCDLKTIDQCIKILGQIIKNLLAS